jgi:hypothetical protein
MLRIHHIKKESGFSFTTAMMVFVFVAAIWAGIQFFQAYFADTKIEQHLTETILKNRNETNDAALASALAADIKARDEIEIDPKQILILRSSDGQKLSVQLPYIRPIQIPLLDKSWNVPFTAKAEENLSRKLN